MNEDSTRSLDQCRILGVFVGGPKTLSDARGEWRSSIARVLARSGTSAGGGYKLSRTRCSRATISTAVPNTRLQVAACGMVARGNWNTRASSVARNAAQSATA